MVKRFLVVLLVFVSNLLSAEVRLKLSSIYEPAQGDTVVKVIHDSTEMEVSEARALGVEGLEEMEEKEVVSVKYPKVITISDSTIIERYGEALVKTIKFFNGRGELKREIDVQGYFQEKIGPARVGFSPNYKYLRINAPIEGEREVKRSKIVVFNTDGDSLWGFEHKLVNVYLSPNGEYMVGVQDLGCGVCPVYLYNKSGKILRKIEKEDQGYDIAFSEDGSFFAVLASRIDWEKEVEKHVDREYSNLVMIGADGKNMWTKKRIAKGAASPGEVKISIDTIIVMTGWNEFKVYYLDKSGKLLKTEQSDIKRAREFKD